MDVLHTLLALSVALFAGLLMSRLTKIWNLPAVTAYLVAGILIGPYCLGQLGVPGLGFISSEDVGNYDIISDVALGFIAFTMGNEFRLSSLKKTGKQATVIAVFQAVTATLFVDIALIGLHFIIPEQLPLAAAITLGAIATATAPAATLMVIKQYKAEGPVTSVLLPVVALDDVVGLIVFAVSFGIAKALESGHIDMVSVLVNPLVEVLSRWCWALCLDCFYLHRAFLPLPQQAYEYLGRLRVPRRRTCHAGMENRCGHGRTLLAFGLHDDGNRILQPVRLLGGTDGSHGSLDRSCDGAVLCNQRCRVTA